MVTLRDTRHGPGFQGNPGTRVTGQKPAILFENRNRRVSNSLKPTPAGFQRVGTRTRRVSNVLEPKTAGDQTPHQKPGYPAGHATPAR